MRILIIGGTRFVGRHIVEAALARGHELTLFTRGESGPGLFPKLDHRRGNRDGGEHAFDSLGDDRWDAVIDTCGYVPRVVTKSASFLADRVGHYTFVSSLSVYADFAGPNTEADGKLATLDDPTTEDVKGGSYGGLKVLCERAAEAALPGRVFNVRPGLIVGPHDPTDRFTWWPARVARGGAILAPGNPQRRVQFIDARDLASWIVDSVEASRVGVFNAVGPEPRPTMAELLDACAEVAGPDAPPREFVWVSEKFLHTHRVAPYSQMPLWIPELDDSFANDKAVAAGLTFRPIRTTIADTLAWHRTREGHEMTSGLAPQFESDLIDVWRSWND